VYNVTNACATGATCMRRGDDGLKAGEPTWAWPWVRKAAGVGRSPVQVNWMEDLDPGRRYDAVSATDGRIAPRPCPARSADRMGVTARSTASGLRDFCQDLEKNSLHSTLNPLPRTRSAMSLEEIN